jgi:16S rRNA processing protein RimM
MGATRPGTDLVLLGVFGRAHGLRGEVRLTSFTADPAAIAAYGALAGCGGRNIVLTGVRPAGTAAPGLLIARVAGIVTRTDAEALNGVRLSVARERLGAAADEDEFLQADLVGLPVEDTAGRRVGTIVGVPNYGGGDLLEIAPADGGATALLPFTAAFAPAVDLAGRRVVIDPPDDLFEPAPRS